MKLKDIHIRDPYILTENGEYYLYGSRGYETWGKCTGLDVYKSCDLEDWSEPVEAFTKPENFWSDTNYWAPEVHKYNGSYYMLVSFVSNERLRGTQILKADCPVGPFLPISDGPVTPESLQCLDGTLYIENGTPYMVFCHEWVQVKNGEVCAVELSPDLKTSVGEPFLLFKASEPSWVSPIREKDEFVTDGPFMHKTANGRLIMIWSSFSDGEYCEALAYSDNGSIKGKWKHDDRLLFKKDGGHGMIFKRQDGRLAFICHRPNNSPNERPHIYDLEEKDDTLFVK